MREPPDLAESSIAESLLTGFGIQAERLVFLPIGNDSASWAYRVGSRNGPDLFLKIRSGGGPMPGAAVPSHLQRHGVPNVLASLPTRAGSPSLPLDRYWLALYPMLEASTGTEAGLSPLQWEELGATVARIHGVPLTPELRRLVGVEAFRPSRRELIGGLDELLSGPGPHDPVTAKLAAFWRERRELILGLVERADRLGRRLAAGKFEPVLCHADLHTWNVLVEPGGALWIVDWDEAILAPKECDLMFAIGGIGSGLVGPSDTERFLEGYGSTTIDRDLLGYYRVAWAVKDIAAYGEEVTALPWLGEESRRAAVDGFMILFEPGEIVDIAADR